MIVTSRGKPLHRRHRWHYSPGRIWLEVRTFRPQGRCVAACAICGLSHAAVHPHPLYCPELARELRATLKHSINGKDTTVYRPIAWTPDNVRSVYLEWKSRDDAAASMKKSADEMLVSVRSALREAGREHLLDALLAPPTPPPPSEPTVRVRALRPYSYTVGGQTYSGGVGCINDLPQRVVKALGSRVEKVGPDVALHGVPLSAHDNVND